MLDVSATDRGLLVPRVALTAANVAAPVVAPLASLLVYNTATAGAAPNAVTPGYYYWSGAPANRWVRFAADGDAWRTTGNAGTVAATNFLGTTDPVALRIRTENFERFEITPGTGAVAGTGGRLRAFQDGTAAEPIYSWSTDPDIGLYRLGADVLGFSTTGTERMQIAANGNVGINGAPNAQAQLDVNSTNRGVLIPRVALTAANNTAPLAAGVAASMLVYNTATAGTAPDNVSPGYHYWDGARWRRLVDLNTNVWITNPLNFAPGTTVVTVTIPGVTIYTGVSVALSGDWATSPQVDIEHVEARTGAVRFRVYNYTFATTYNGMDFIITTTRY